jgi:hypothetical protein
MRLLLALLSATWSRRMTTPLNEGTVPAAVPADRAVMQQALDAMVAADEHFCARDIQSQRLVQAIAAVRAALATSAPPPVEAGEPSREQIEEATQAADEAYVADQGKPRDGWNHYFARALFAATHPKEPTEARGDGVQHRPNTCKLTECQGKPRCKKCVAMDGCLNQSLKG